VRMLEDTEPAFKVWLYRCIVFVQHFPIWLLRREGALGPAQLFKALAGDPGALPERPSRRRSADNDVEA